MTHLTPLQLSMHADQALDVAETAVVTRHLQDCAQCQAELAALSAEAQVLTRAMLHDTATEPLQIPKFSRPASLREFAIANLFTGLVIWLAQFLWKTIFGELIMNAATWLTSVYLPDIYSVASATFLHYLNEGTAMFDAYLGYIVLSLISLTVVWLLLIYRRSGTAVSLCVLVLLGATAGTPVPAHALDFRQSQGVVTIAADEVVDDTLVVTADTIVIKGKVTGDVIAAGRRIDVSADIAGNLTTFAESITVSGSVGGFVLGAGGSLDLHAAQVGGDVWAAGERVVIGDATSVARNVMFSGKSVNMHGTTGRDVYAFAEEVEVSGAVGEDLEAFAARVRLMDTSRVLGNARMRIASEDSLQRADGARIDGQLEFLDTPKQLQKTSRYAQVQFYLWQIARLISALLVGLALFWLWPGLAKVTLDGGIDGLKTAGLGLVALVSLPVVAALVALTIVGFPFAVMAVVAWVLTWYLAKIVLAGYVGRLVLGDSDYGQRNVWVLLTGLGVVIVAINLPAIGGVLNFLLTIIGVGMLAQQVARRFTARESAASS